MENIQAEELNKKACDLYQQEKYEEAMDVWKQSCKVYHPESMYHLGCCYYEGVGTEVDHKMAFNIFMTCVKKNSEVDAHVRECMFNVANAYFNGDGVEKNLESAYDWYEKAANEGHPSAAFNIAYSYYSGNGREQDFEKAFKYISVPAREGMPQALYMLGTLLLAGRGCEQDVKAAVKMFKFAAEEGFEPANATLEQLRQAHGDSFIDDDDEDSSEDDEDDDEEIDGVKLSEFEKLFKGVQRVSLEEFAEMPFVNIHNADIVMNEEDKKYDESLDNLDFENMSKEDIDMEALKDNRFAMYISGKSALASGDEEFAFKLFSRSAALGFAFAQYELGMCYIKGIGTRPDGMTGFGWIVKAAKQNHPQALKVMLEYYMGVGNADKVLEISHILCDEFDDLTTCENLGYYYYKGIGTDIDIEKAKYYLNKAVEKDGSGTSHCMLGELYLLHERNSEGVNKAYELLLKAVKKGEKQALFYLGIVLKISGNKKEAIAAFKKALEAGIEEAREQLKELGEDC